jgi:SAM-dependent methyltransferase
MLAALLVGGTTFVDTSSEVRTITDLHKSQNTKAHKPTKESKDSKDSKVAHTNSTSFHAKKTDDFWRLKPNNGSPYMCDVSLYDWFGKLANDSGKVDKKLTIMDIGGGYGEKGDMIEKMHPHTFKYSCVDVTAQGRCKEFDGAKMPHADNSFDIVTFVYSLHHAGDAVFSLLREAKRVAKRHVVVLDDLMGTTDHTLDFQFGHGGCQNEKDSPRVCMFRSDKEYREIFGLLDLKISYAADVKELFNCEPNYKIPRGLYVLNPKSPAHSGFLRADEQRSFHVKSPKNALAPVLQ